MQKQRNVAISPFFHAKNSENKKRTVEITTISTVLFGGEGGI